MKYSILVPVLFLIIVKRLTCGRMYFINTNKGNKYFGKIAKGQNKKSGADYSGADYSGQTESIQQIEGYYGYAASLKCEFSQPFFKCQFISPSGESFLVSSGQKYQDGRISCLCMVEKFDPTRFCGIRIQDLKEVDKGEWKCVLDANLNGKTVTASQKIMLIPKPPPTSLQTTIPTTTHPTLLTQCMIESLSFALDISDSMSFKANEAIWKPMALKLIEEMDSRQVNIKKHYLFTYVDTIDPAKSTHDPQEFKDTIQNWSSYGGSDELTFAALKHAMEQVNTNAFICVWTDEIGEDTNDAALKTEILNLKEKTHSEIFFMIIAGNNHIRVEDCCRNFEDFEQTFNGIGYVFDIRTDPDVISKIIKIMKKTAICNSKPPPTSLQTTIPTTTHPTLLTQCRIESLSFALDRSGSMKGESQEIFKSVALKLIEEMTSRQVNINKHYLFTYVDKIDPAKSTQDPQEFMDTIQNFSTFGGTYGIELTFGALKHAMEQVNTNAFICVWTDEIGDDTNDADLRTEILNLKDKTHSEIFFMIIPGNNTGRDNGNYEQFAQFEQFEQRFNGIGHVFNIKNDPDVISKIIKVMKETAICN